MKRCTLAGTLIVACLELSRPSVAAAQTPVADDDVALLRVFLKDGTTLVSYGEFARVNNRVIFSMPIRPGAPAGARGVGAATPPLHLVDIAADRIDWERTTRYAESARTTHYISTRAETDYAEISNQVAQTLNEVAAAPDASKRLALVERARSALAEWPRNHFNYRAGEVRQMLTLLDEAIADLRAASGSRRFDLSLTANSVESPFIEPLLPPPTPKDAIEQTLLAARMSDAAADRESLLEAALDSLTSLERSSAAPPASWVDATRIEAQTALRVEREIDRHYQLLSRRVLQQADQRARRADVRGLERMLASIDSGDEALGRRRPDAVSALLSTVQLRLDAARQLRLARDRWVLRAPHLYAYRAAITAPIDVMALVARLKPALEDIKSLAGTSPSALGAILRCTSQILERVSAIVPPDELSGAHALLVSAAQMARQAAYIRREAALYADMARAWDASSAAAGALMLSARARSEMQSLMQPPQPR